MVGALLFTGEGGGSWGRKGGKRIDPDGAWLTADEAVTRDESSRDETRRDETRLDETIRLDERTNERTNERMDGRTEKNPTPIFPSTAEIHGVEVDEASGGSRLIV